MLEERPSDLFFKYIYKGCSKTLWAIADIFVILKGFPNTYCILNVYLKISNRTRAQVGLDAF